MVKSIEITALGDLSGLDIQPLEVAVLKGVLSSILEGVNYVNAPYLAKLNPNYLQDCVVYQVGEFATTTMEVSPTVRRQIDWNSYNHPEDEGSIKSN